VSFPQGWSIKMPLENVRMGEAVMGAIVSVRGGLGD
jgi:hypothetical protein